MRIGDVLEWLAAAALTYAAFLLGGLASARVATAAAAITVAICLAYLGQCYGATPIRLPTLLRRKREPT